MLEVDEYKQMADKLAIAIKDTDKVRGNDFIETEDYIDSLEEQLDRFQDQIEAQDQYICNLEEQIEELKLSNKTLTT